MDVAKRKEAPIINRRLQSDRQQKKGRLAWGGGSRVHRKHDGCTYKKRK